MFYLRLLCKVGYKNIFKKGYNKMSNHDGSYMLNEVLVVLEKYDFFKLLSKEKTLKFIEKIVDIGSGSDCNTGEILEEIGEKLNICYCCLKYAEEFSNGLCSKCYD